MVGSPDLCIAETPDDEPFDTTIPDPDDDSEASWTKLNDSDDDVVVDTAEIVRAEEEAVVSAVDVVEEFSGGTSTAASEGVAQSRGWGKLIGGALVAAGVGLGTVGAAVALKKREEESVQEEEERKEEEKRKEEGNSEDVVH